jgi:uncharacterized protein (TIGR00288 family)
LLIDGPNVLRRQFEIRLDDLKDIVEELGKIGVAKVYLDEHASRKLLEAISNSGFTSVVTPHDVHLCMVVDAMDLILGSTTNLLAIFSRHARTAPILRRARENGINTLAIGFEPGFSVAVQNAADSVLRLDLPIPPQLTRLKDKKGKVKEDLDEFET